MRAGSNDPSWMHLSSPEEHDAPPLAVTTGDLEGITDILVEPDPGTNSSDVLSFPIAPDIGILDHSEDQALGPTMFIDTIQENVGALIPSPYIPLSAYMKDLPKENFSDYTVPSSRVVQESKLGGWKLKNRLQQILPNAAPFEAFSRTGKAQAILIMSKAIPVSEWGTCGSGYAVCVKTHLNGQEVGIISLHAPNKGRLRIQTWRWLADRIHTGNWIICGDFNQVAHIRDSIGPSPRMRGTEDRVWTNISQKRDLADCYFDAASRSGPRFTRQAKCGRRLDRSRLDRVYVTDSGMWLNHIASIKHFGGHIAGDHIPTCATLQLTAAVNNITVKPQSYFKLNASILKQPEIRDKIKAIWADHPPGCTDARRRWSLAWARVKDFCRDLHKSQTDQHNIRELQKEVENRRRFLPYDCSEEDIQELSQLEQELNTIEDQEASLWYLRSRSKWLREGEAPTRYFFNLAKSRFSKDRISGLQKDNGEFVTGQTDILQVVECYYSDLYNAESKSLESWLARQEVMRLIDKRIPESEGDNLRRPPTDDEIDATVKSLKRGKAPGLDGITNDMIIDCWEFIRQDCIEMVRTFWDRKILLHHDSQGCIKLLAKNDKKQWIKNWRPITLMSCTYKSISKLVANRMKPLLPYLIDPEQSGFFPGRKIDDNILSLCLAEEWGKVSGDSNLFVKLDFTKAFDRVSFTFLWHTLRSMGFPEDFIARIRGLMTGGTSKLHVNQAFTSSIKIKRGVRQGCPLAPLLFALSTQPVSRSLKGLTKCSEVPSHGSGSGQASGLVETLSVRNCRAETQVPILGCLVWKGGLSERGH
ncbi:hypothetical protein R1sor_006465 [Riccia sorocarpa]|uniref:Reverse transcriptase domain-containing protein n=1 Tax=Riccia sorocarpa TaxID=122646 RepID=A0ABD3HQQ5_9MARC